MNIKTIIFCISFCCLFIASLAYGDSSSDNNSNNVSISDPQKTIVVKKNKPFFSIILQSNHTTGFYWSLKNYDSYMIKPINSTYFSSNKTSLIGAGGYEKWIFSVKQVGFVVPQTTSITLIYARPSDLQGAQAINFKVVTVNDN